MGQNLSSRRRNRRQQQQASALLNSERRSPLSPLSSRETPTFAPVHSTENFALSSSESHDEGVEMQSHWVSSDVSSPIEENCSLSSSPPSPSLSAESPSTQSVREEATEVELMEEFESELSREIELAELELPSLLNEDSDEESQPSNENSQVSSPNLEVSAAQPRQSYRLSIIYFVPYRRRNLNGNNSATESSEIPLNSEESEEFSALPLLNDQLFRILFAMTLPIGANVANGGDFHNGSFEDLLDYLMRQHQPQGPPPTSKSVLNKLPVLSVDQEMTAETCLVCQENFQMEESALKLPCKHLFHKDCVTTWLEQHCTCPTCRYELPVDDKDYETERKKRMAGRNINEDYQDEPVQTTESAEEKNKEEIDSMEIDSESSPNFERNSSHNNFHAKFSQNQQQEAGATDASTPTISSQ
eukprot:TRINITY_DN1534_c0_g1_i1.p1 TRINITY_DN1534_c0_g1~~TRINITY_DN1534_c0_g1_i1.p1  ORF type:complete len:416 (-),score=173.62 TRINITY_DN1534_c0_g1_i1:366-1613(-)